MIKAEIADMVHSSAKARSNSGVVVRPAQLDFKFSLIFPSDRMAPIRRRHARPCFLGSGDGRADR
jgi:hypothetical protein